MFDIKIRKQINYKRILLHILFWVSELTFNTFLFSVSSGNYLGVFKATLFIMPFEIFVTYLTLYYFIPKFLLNKKYFKFIIYSLITAIIAGVIVRLMYLYVFSPLTAGEEVILDLNRRISENPITTIFLNYAFFNLYVEIYSIVGFATAIKLFKYWLNNQRIKNELEKQNIKSELALLQNQINPHFLFNTLNNIDTLIQKDSKKASDAILKLSEIMRYMLYEANTDKVPLINEMEYLISYISLQQIRLRKENFIKFTIEGDYEGRAIPPMLLISFIENAFKHGLKEVSPPGIIVKLIINRQNIQFECINYFSKYLNINKDKTEGIGLSNVKRRLELLYPNKHKLKITKETGKFTANLLLKD
ncbi:MAG: histidine kinase [Bacteroidales bacterium]|nr:histidine kinase [Bacteroidales bacterium]